jgi:hypothetical protein
MKILAPILFGLCLIGSNELWSQTATAPSGSGTSGDPYQIDSLANLYWITQNSSSWADYFQQTSDIDASSSSGWSGGQGFSPIGNVGTNFTGTYDGNGHTISGLHIANFNVYQGLFGIASNSAQIKNVGLESENISADSYVGGLAGDAHSATISNCYSSGSIQGTTGGGGSGDYVGGLVGFHESPSTITDCYSTASVTGAGRYVGGLVGESGNSISNSYSTGSVSGASGGIAIGGLVGESNFGSITNCYSTGSVSGPSSTDVGGFVGYNYFGTITNCYSTGNVSGASATNIGGLVGLEHSGTVSNCFWDKSTSGMSASADGTGKTTMEMKTLSTFTSTSTSGLTTAWDFETNPYDDAANNDYWDMDTVSGSFNNGYPFLSWQNGATIVLPVELVSFTVDDAVDGIELLWQMATGSNTFRFEVQRATVGLDEGASLQWMDIGYVKAGGASNSPRSYSFVDPSPINGEVEYRLKQIDADGKVTYSDAVTARSGMPADFALSRNYPNPFNPTTTIRYSLPKNVHVQLEVYDASGRLIATPVDGQQNAGVHFLSFDASFLASGVYFYRLVTPSFMQTRKMMLVK